MTSSIKTNTLLVLDLDETLIHASESELAHPADFRVDAYHVYRRPKLHEFLVDVAQWFDVALWSAADDSYVNEIAERIKPEGFTWTFVWGRSKCTTKLNAELDKYVHEKRLKKVKKLGYPLERILIVDDSPEKTRENYGNAVYIKPFEGDVRDQELLNLTRYLEGIANCENVRTLEKRGWGRSE